MNQHDYLKKPRLLKGWKWLIEWEELLPASTKKIRVRKTFDLNRSCFVADPKAREQRAQDILEDLLRNFSSTKIEAGTDSLEKTNIIDALQFALDIKLRSDREHTRITYRSFFSIMKSYLVEFHLESMRCDEFGMAQADKFLDWVLLTKKTRYGKSLTNRTYNNYVINYRSLFYELARRKYIKENPFANRGKRKEEQKIRQAFDQADSNIISKQVYSQDKDVYLAILLISHCGLRLSECARLRVRDIDLDRGLIVMGGNQTKNHDRAFITVPSSIIPVLKSLDFHQFPGNYYILGKSLRPSASETCGRNTINRRFSAILDEMVKNKKISSRVGYSAYSWKDTGAIMLVKQGVDIISIQKHLRHKSLETTQRYLVSLGIINQEIRDFKGVIFLLPGEF